MLQPDLSEFEIPAEEAERRISGQQEQAKRSAHPDKTGAPVVRGRGWRNPCAEDRGLLFHHQGKQR